MGRKTYASIGRPLPDRRSIVVEPQPGVCGGRCGRCGRCGSGGGFKQALDLTAEEAEVFVIGGGHLYQLALPFTQRIYLTRDMHRGGRRCALSANRLESMGSGGSTAW